MSVQTEGDRPSVDLPHNGDLAFGALMDALVSEEEGTGAPAAEGTPANTAGGAGTAGQAPANAAGNVPQPDGNQPAAPAAGGTPASGSGDAAAGQPASAAAPGAPGSAPESAGTPAGSAEQPPAVSGGTDLPADWTATADELLPKFGQLSTALEENVSKAYQQQAYTQAREDYEKYFEALEKHPRLLVGTQVPAIGKEGMDTLRDSDDAKEWQEAVRSLLVEEIKAQAESKMEESASFLETVHASIDLFKNNKDLIPGTRNFDRELADTFAKMMTPYEVRVEGKLQGYSIPVQPIIENLRGQLTARRTAAKPPPAAPSSAPPPAQRRQAEPPQAGIQSKASSGAEPEDFSTLFGTIGLPNLQI